MATKTSILEKLPTKTVDGTTLYNVAREGGMPWWVDGEKAIEILAHQEKVAATVATETDNPDSSAE